VDKSGGLRILIVDDLRDFRIAAQELFERRGHVVVAAVTSRNDALEAAVRLAPDLVLVDMRLGGESGVDTASALAARCPGLPVVLMSMGDLAISSELLEAYGARGFLLKDRLLSTDLRTFLET
jgi:two-component system, NarL family, nitrate/nitrite response regulator NarL